MKIESVLCLTPECVPSLECPSKKTERQSYTSDLHLGYVWSAPEVVPYMYLTLVLTSGELSVLHRSQPKYALRPLSP